MKTKHRPELCCPGACVTFVIMLLTSTGVELGCIFIAAAHSRYFPAFSPHHLTALKCLQCELLCIFFNVVCYGLKQNDLKLPLQSSQSPIRCRCSPPSISAFAVALARLPPGGTLELGGRSPSGQAWVQLDRWLPPPAASLLPGHPKLGEVPGSAVNLVCKKTFLGMDLFLESFVSCGSIHS